jgi:hypothetical protein
MFDFLTKWRSRRQAEHDAYVATLQSVVQVVESMARASEAQALVFQDFLAFYKVTPGDLPTSRVHTDMTEAAWEAARMEKLRASGFPVDASATDQGRWVATQMDFGGSF